MPLPQHNTTTSMNITFAKGRPYTPLMQLLNVLPSQSGPFLPEPYRDLMVRALMVYTCLHAPTYDVCMYARAASYMRSRSARPLTVASYTATNRPTNQVREDSPLREFYPPDFETDRNGKQNTW